MTTPAEQHSVKADTEYVVLVWREDGEDNVDGVWADVNQSVTARSATAAIQAAAATHAIEAMAKTGASKFLYVAVPARSWQPKWITPKVEPRFVIEGAGMTPEEKLLAYLDELDERWQEITATLDALERKLRATLADLDQAEVA